MSSEPALDAHPPAPFDDDEVATTLRVLEAIAADRTRLTAIPKETRRALLIAAGRVSRPEKDELVRMSKAFRRQERAEVREADRHALEQSGLRRQRKSAVYQPLWLEPPGADDEDGTTSGPELREERTCYVCKAKFRQVHFFYDSMCGSCGDFNYAKRKQTAPLQGRIALVTGARVKIGYQTSLILLRGGAKVVATTRFPRDAALRYAQEPDYSEWAHRLQIHGLDLRHAPSVELFARWLADTEPKLDLLVNNACQTVRRPAGWYEHLLDAETTPFASLPEPQRRTLARHEELKDLLRGVAALPARTEETAALAIAGGAPGVGIADSARLSQLRYLDDDFRSGREVFPQGRYDEDLQQVDLRETNSWRLTLAEVATPELLEVHLVNAVAPYVLNAKLKPLMMREPTFDQHVVNVSAMEGQFYRAKKTDRHPHTNMAKAALNMMTRTSAPDYAKDGIFMNSVDTGWVTDEDPAVHAARKAELGFQPPLDIIDGAARILDPFLNGLLTGEHVFGQFLKDYRPAPW